MKNEINIGLLGFGTVGSGVAKIMHGHQQDLQYKLGVEVTIKKVLVKDISKSRDTELSSDIFTNNLEEVLNDPSIDLIIEVMGGTNGAKDAIERALLAGGKVLSQRTKM